MTVDLTPEAIGAVRKVLGDPKSKHHAKMVAAVLDRTMPIPKASMVVVENNVVVDQSGDAMLERLRFLCNKHGIDADALISGKMTKADLAERLQIEAKPVEPDAEPRP